MGDILLQYDWNNHKGMNGERLVSEFYNLSLSDKLKVYRTLRATRKTLLHKGYKAHKKNLIAEQLENDIKLTLEPIKELLCESDIKTRDEMLLTLGLILEHCTTRIYYESEDDGKNQASIKRDEESFESTQTKMLDWIDKLSFRATGLTSNHNQGLHEAIKELVYHKPHPIEATLSIYQIDFEAYYLFLGVGKTRVKTISKALVNMIKSYNELSRRKPLVCIRALHIWAVKIPNYLIDDAQDFLYAVETATMEQTPKLDIDFIRGKCDIITP